MSVSSVFILLCELTSKIICMSVCVTMSKKVNKIQSPMRKPCFDCLLSVLARDGILLNVFHDANGAFRCSLDVRWKLIRKIQKWLYNLHINP